MKKLWWFSLARQTAWQVSILALTEENSFVLKLYMDFKQVQNRKFLLKRLLCSEMTITFDHLFFKFLQQRGLKSVFNRTLLKELDIDRSWTVSTVRIRKTAIWISEPFTYRTFKWRCMVKGSNLLFRLPKLSRGLDLNPGQDATIEILNEVWTFRDIYGCSTYKNDIIDCSSEHFCMQDWIMSRKVWLYILIVNIM